MTVTASAPPVADDDVEPLAEPADAAASPTPPLRERLLGYRPSDVLWGWLGPLIITAIGGFLRFWNLNKPPRLDFDEAYYVKQAYSMMKWGWERRWVGDEGGAKATNLWDQNKIDQIWVMSGGDQADYVVHPPLGKWMIAFGEWIIGPTYRYGWRFSVALVGTLSILMLARIARRMFGSTLLGCTAGLLLAVDGMHFTQSRTGLLDIFVMFWALAGFGFILIDRDRSRARLAARVEAGDRPKWYLPWQWWRPFHLLAALCFGLGAGVKWSGAFFLAVFLVASVLWDLGARRASGEKHWLPSILPSGIYGAITAIPVAIAAYLATWFGWFASKDAWDRQWGFNNPQGYGAGILPNTLRGLLHYHHEVYKFHVGVTDDHPWQSNPWSWLVMGRPTLFWLDGGAQCPPGMAGPCTQAVHNLGTPAIWWAATLGVFVLFFCWAFRRDWRAGAILAGFVAGYVPWFNYQERTIFTFYAIAFTPWVILAVVYCLGLVLGPRDADPDRRFAGAVAAGGFVVLCVAMFGYFYPIYSGDTIPQSVWDSRTWLPSWR